MTAQPRGMLDRDTLAALVEAGEIGTVLVAFPDMYGRLLGKRYDAGYFLEAADRGLHFCDYLLACDMEMNPVPGYQFTGWDRGYKDAWGDIDWSTLRRASWLDRSALVLCDIRSEASGAPVEIVPRSVLRHQIERASAAGLRAKGACELEFFVFSDSYETAREKHYHDLRTFGSYIEDYHLFQGTKTEPLLAAIRSHLGQSGIPVEFSKGEWGAGQAEINIRYADLDVMADRTTIFKQAAKEIAFQQGLGVTFMAKWHEAHAGSSMHVHFSLWDEAGGRSHFTPGASTTADAPGAESDVFRWALGGMLARGRELALFFAPTVNSYKRFQAASFAPTALAWGYDNRTTGFRVVGHGPALRIECRIPGADANPYLALAALLAAALDGIEHQIEPPPAFSGDAYSDGTIPHIPRSLPEAIAAFEHSDLARRAFGDAVVEHYLHFARTEQQAFEATVTCWERQRYFERI